MNNDVSDLCVYDDGGGPRLYACGSFTAAGEVPANRVARWNGGSWEPLGDGLNGEVRCLTVHDEGTGDGAQLYAGGLFTASGATPVLRVARWDGAQWHQVGEGFDATVWAIASVELPGSRVQSLIAGGDFTLSGTTPMNSIAEWHNGAWQPIGDGTSLTVRDVLVYDDGDGAALYAAGYFVASGALPSECVRRWDGEAWSSINDQMIDSYARALASFDDGSGKSAALLVGGGFLSSAAGDSYLAQYRGCADDTPNLADLNGDGRVDGFDLGLLLGQWGPCLRCSADINGDGVVGELDLAILLGSWS